MTTLDAISKAYQGKTFQDQKSPWYGIQNQTREPAEPTAESQSEEADYLVVGFPGGPSNFAFLWAKDAVQMQSIVEDWRQKSGFQQIVVFKRMLRMKAKIGWETVDADV